MFKHIAGGVKRLSDGAKIPEDPDNAQWQEVLAWAAIEGNEIESADAPRELTYREKRERAYIGMNAADGLAKDIGDAMRTVGDVLDILIHEVVARGPSVNVEFQQMVAKIAAIKLKYPKV